MTDFLDLVKRRYSVRSYRPDPVPRDVLERVLEAARLAPTAANRQPWHMIIVDRPELMQKLAEAYAGAWFAQAPVALIMCLDHGAGWVRKADGRSYIEVDAAIAMDHLILAAAEQGLGTCWIAAFKPEVIRKLFLLPTGIEPFLLTPLGYTDSEPPPKRRKPPEQLFHWNRW
jgi:nitroreductase